MTHDPDSNISAGMFQQTMFGGWNSNMAEAPIGEPVLAFGSYWYPFDKNPTTYMDIAAATGDPQFPMEDWEGKRGPDVYSHWMRLPNPPPIERTAT